MYICKSKIKCKKLENVLATTHWYKIIKKEEFTTDYKMYMKMQNI